ncbi:hypothetical protein BDB01DRAFT_855295 [Pilobolus umbonatus]|nr:hypothetical protein BDB01DRAFT_855295 [Pilobolus umbonatus]
MSTSESAGSVTDSGVIRTLSDTIQIPNYRFKGSPITAGDNVYIIFGYRISNKKPVIAKISSNSLRLEREYYIIRRLYQLNDGPSYIVQPLEYVHLSNGLTVTIYEDETHSQPFEEDKPKDKKNGLNKLNKYLNKSLSFSSFRPSYDLGTFLRFAIKCTDCLEFIHRHNVIHGEIRLTTFQWSGVDTDNVKMWNFGSGTSSFESYLTSEGWRKSAINKSSFELLQSLLVYMSPEQTGRTNYIPDHCSDIYSLGIVFFVLLTNKYPFDGGPLEILNGILSRKIPLVHEIQLDVPGVVSRIIEKMTNKSPEDRYKSAHGIRADLKECLRRLEFVSESQSEVIESFPLAERDVASVFILPKMIYGRQNLIGQMTDIIERVSRFYRSFKTRKSITVTGISTDIYQSSGGSLESMYNDAYSNHDTSSVIGGAKSNVSPSYCSGLDNSDTSVGRIVDGMSGVEIVAISGPGGVGKSTLFHALQNVARQHGYVAMIKFDSRHKVPYRSLLKSLSQLLQQILSESEEEIHAFYHHLTSHLGPQSSKMELLTDLVPELKTLLDSTEGGCQEEVIETSHLDNVGTRIRFHSLFIEVFRALTQWRMITLFLDDIHSADDPSMELIESMIQSRLKILIFTAYRDNESSPAIELLMHNDMALYHHYNVQELDFDSLLEYISDSLHRRYPEDLDYIKPLADIVYMKTRGNAFYLSQLLTTWEKKKLIFFNWETKEWDYNLSAIQLAVVSTDKASHDAELNIEFLMDRIRELPSDGQRLLKWASFVGDTFSWNTVKYLMSLTDADSEFSEPESSDHDSTKMSRDSHTVSTQSDRSRDSLEKLRRDPLNGLQAAIQEGYIIPLELDEFKWSHDRYSQAAMALANPKSRERIHLRIVEFLLNGNIPNDGGQGRRLTFFIFITEGNVDTLLVADHLLKCLELVKALENRICYKDILCDAGNRARSSGAHRMAYEYYKAAISLLSNEEWSENAPNSILYLYSNAVSLSWIVGEYDMTERLLHAIFKNTTEPIDRITAYRTQQKYFFARQMHTEGSESLWKCLRELNVGDISTNDPEVLHSKYDHVIQIIDAIGLDKIQDLPLCNDNKVKSIMSIIEELCTVVYWQGNQVSMFYLICTLVQLTLIHGISSVSGIAIVYLGMVSVEKYHQYDLGERLGRIGVTVSEKYGFPTEKGRAFFLYANLLLQWKHHHRESIPWFRTSLKSCLEGGDRIYASFAHLHVATAMFTTGYNLSEVLKEAATCHNDIHSWSSSLDTNILIISIIRTIKSLQGLTGYKHPETVFDEEDGFNDEHFIKENREQNSNIQVPLNWYDSFRMIPLVLYGHYEYATALGYVCIRGIRHHPCHRHTRMMLTLHSLAILQKIRIDRLQGEAYTIYMDRVNENQILLKEWVDHAPVNYCMWYTLIEAEKAGLINDTIRAMKLYEEAINQAREGRWHFDLCICHEYAGGFYYRNGIQNVAYGLIKKAIDLYSQHGSYGKADHLADQYSDILMKHDDNRIESNEMGVQTDPFPLLGANGPWSVSSPDQGNDEMDPYLSETLPPATTEQTLLTLDIVDMASILKSSQVISSEVKFDSLLKSMMTIILENSGADCGAIIVKEEKYGIYAYGSQQEGARTFDPPRSLSNQDDLISSKIIHHTINTGDSIFIHNVEQDARFAVGPWFERAGNKSVICMPIIHKSTLVGCLIIEGTVGIFTQRHVNVLSLLCQQMGISISNAFLFKSVQRVTKANVRMIEMQKSALEDARKSKEAAVRATRLREIFLANMSHEIRTPFSGFYGMISLLADTELNSEQRDLVKTAKESCEILLQIIDDLLNFSKLQAGKVVLDLSPLAIEDLIADVVEMLIAMAIQKNINITYMVTDDVPLVVMADGNRLRQILVNLLGNAIKFTHEGEICIKCSAGKQSADNSHVELQFHVIDTGIGISDDQKKVLFEPFSQVDGSTTRKYGGTGLGLSICLQLVELMEGSINVESTPAKGSDFYFKIYVSNSIGQNGMTLQTDTWEERKVLIDCVSPLKVLIISKYPSTVDMIKHMLTGVDVDGVIHIEEFLELVNKNKYDIIIVGLFMNPETNSISSHWLEQASKINKDGLIIIMSYPAGGYNQRSQWIQSVSNKNLFCKAIRMPVPIRRVKLLKTIAEMSNIDIPISCPVTSNKLKKVKLFTEDELEFYSKLNILIAEDNPVAQILLMKQLSRLGFHVESANNGLEAISAWRNREDRYFAMAFFDHHMPKCDGVAATKKIREIEANENRTRFPIVALTADVQESAKLICLNAGMDGYMTKPLNQKVLAETLRRFCIK